MKQLNQVEILAVNGSGDGADLAYTNAALIATGMTIGCVAGMLLTKQQAAILAYGTFGLSACLITAFTPYGSSIMSFIPPIGFTSLCTAIFAAPYFA